jgi:hypothetical protein
METFDARLCRRRERIVEGVGVARDREAVRHITRQHSSRARLTLSQRASPLLPARHMPPHLLCAPRLLPHLGADDGPSVRRDAVGGDERGRVARAHLPPIAVRHHPAAHDRLLDARRAAHHPRDAAARGAARAEPDGPLRAHPHRAQRPVRDLHADREPGAAVVKRRAGRAPDPGRVRVPVGAPQLAPELVRVARGAASGRRRAAVHVQLPAVLLARADHAHGVPGAHAAVHAGLAQRRERRGALPARQAVARAHPRLFEEPCRRADALLGRDDADPARQLADRDGRRQAGGRGRPARLLPLARRGRLEQPAVTTGCRGPWGRRQTKSDAAEPSSRVMYRSLFHFGPRVGF